VIRWSWAIVLVGLGGFVTSLLLFRGLPKELTPSEDQSILIARLTTPVGASIERTDAATKEVERVLRARPEVQRLFVSIGGFGGGQVNTAVVFVTLVPKDQRDLSVNELIAAVRPALGKIPDLRVAFQDPSQQGFTARRGYPIEFALRGSDWDELARVSNTLMERMRASDRFQDVDSDYLAGMPELQVLPDRDRAAAMGVSMEDIGRTLNVLVGGVRAGTYEDRGAATTSVSGCSRSSA
jgi:multidrug efflux pump subunit AcrB